MQNLSFDTPVDALGLSLATLARLQKEGIKTLRDLTDEEERRTAKAFLEFLSGGGKLTPAQLKKLRSLPLSSIHWGGGLPRRYGRYESRGTRVRNCLASCNLKTLGDLVELSEQELCGLKHFGKTSLDYVKEKLGQFGLKLNESV